MGRKKKPTAMKKEQGGQIRGVDKHEPQVEIEMIAAMPEGLNEFEQEKWKDLAGQLNELRVYTKSDRNSFERLFNLCLMEADLIEKLGKKYIVLTQSGEKLNPVFTGLMNVTDKITRILSEFGMTPASRSKVSTVPKKQVNKLEALLNAK